MKNILYGLACFLLLAACSTKAVPDWIKTSHQQIENYKKLALQGRDHSAEASFERTVSAIKTGGDLRLLQIAVLTRSALQIAMLETYNDAEYRALEDVEQHAENVHFNLFLKGDFERVREQHLPPRYRPFLRACKDGNQPDIDLAIAAMEDPLSRLVASGIAVRKQLYHENTLNTAIRTASEQGWKKALLAYLNRLRDDYISMGEQNKAVSTQQRIDLIR